MLKTDGNPFLGEQPFATDCHFSCHFVVGRLTPDCAIDRTLRNTTLHDKSKNHLGELKISKCPLLCVLTTLFICKGYSDRRHILCSSVSLAIGRPRMSLNNSTCWAYLQGDH